LSHRWWRYTEAVILFPHLRPFYFDYALVKSFCELVILAVNAQLWRVFIKSCLDGRWNSGPAGDSSRLVALVIFIGGVTFAEISALRFLSAQEGMKYDFIVATTKLINGQNLLKTFIDDPSAVH
jgi:hypothetical protein